MLPVVSAQPSITFAAVSCSGVATSAGRTAASAGRGAVRLSVLSGASANTTGAGTCAAIPAAMAPVVNARKP